MSDRSRFARYLSRVSLSAALLGAFLVASPPAQAYAPGNASVISLERNPYTGAWEYSCSFSGWRSGAKVVYHCELFGYTVNRGYWLLGSNQGSWTPPPSSITRSGADMAAVGSGNICVRARAYSVDGGANSGYRLCRFSW